MTPGSFIREHLEDNKLSISAAARESKFNRSTLSKLINDKVEVTVNLAWELERGLGIDATILLELQVIKLRKLRKGR